MCVFNNVTLVVPFLCTVAILLLAAGTSPTDASWCISCSQYEGASPNCTSFDLSDALGVVLYNGSSPTFSGTIRGSDLLLNGPGSYPVYTSLILAENLAATGFLAASVLLIALSAGLCFARCVHAEACRFCVCATGGSMLMAVWGVVVLGTLVLSAEALASWRTTLGSGGFCDRICSDPAPPGRLSCSASSASALGRMWVGPGRPDTIGPTMMNALLTLSVLNGEKM